MHTNNNKLRNEQDYNKDFYYKLMTLLSVLHFTFVIN